MAEVEQIPWWNKILDNWKVIVTLGGIFMALVAAYVTVFHQNLHSAEEHPVSATSFSKLVTDVEVAANDAAHNKETLERVDAAVVRLEEKFDRLTILILEQRN